MDQLWSMLVQQIPQLANIDRFHKVMVESRCHGFEPVMLLAVSCHRNEECMRGFPLCL
jgi:hypothetical protein